MEERINELVFRLNNELEKLSIPLERKVFHPHVTLLRIRGDEDLQSLKKMTDTVLNSKFTAGEIALYQSRLIAHGSIYKELLNYKLN
jgi:2'-5' RNA ligase